MNLQTHARAASDAHDDISWPEGPWPTLDRAARRAPAEATRPKQQLLLEAAAGLLSASVFLLPLVF